MRLRHADPSHLAKEPEVAPHHIQLLLLGVARRHWLERLLQVVVDRAALQKVALH